MIVNACAYSMHGWFGNLKLVLRDVASSLFYREPELEPLFLPRFADLRVR